MTTWEGLTVYNGKQDRELGLWCLTPLSKIFQQQNINYVINSYNIKLLEKLEYLKEIKDYNYFSK